MARQRLDLVGRVFGRLTVVSFSHVKHGAHWLCRCECGQTKTVEGSKLVGGRTVSCGCYMRERQHAIRPRIKHGHTSVAGGSSATYRTWDAMIQRCTNPASSQWRNYGGRGIAVCDRWRDSFAAFLADVGERPDGMTIDRVDGDRNYEPGNVRWATRAQQSKNRRNTLNDVARCLVVYLKRRGERTVDVAYAFGVTEQTITRVIREHAQHDEEQG